MNQSDISKYLKMTMKEMSNGELEDFIFSIIHLTRKLREQFPGMTNNDRRLVAMQYRRKEINRRKGNNNAQ